VVLLTVQRLLLTLDWKCEPVIFLCVLACITMMCIVPHQSASTFGSVHIYIYIYIYIILYIDIPHKQLPTQFYC